MPTVGYVSLTTMLPTMLTTMTPRQKQIDEDCRDDGFTMKPKALHSWLTRVLYNRR